MKAVVKYKKGEGNVALQSMPDPICQPEQVILKVNCCGICGTDIHVYHDSFKNYPPVIMGHEFSGEVIETGSRVEGVSKGDRFSVLGATAVTCGQCRYCRQGEFMFCQVRRGMGHGVHGAFAPFAVARPDQLYKLPPGVSMREAALVEPLAAAVHAVCDVADFKLGDTVLVSGPGPIGLLCIKLLLDQSIKVIVLGTSQDQDRLQLARKWGVAATIMVDRQPYLEKINELTSGQGVDLAFECAGAEASVAQCLQAVRPLAQFVQVGHFGHTLKVPWDHIAFKQLRIHGSVGYNHQTWDQTMKILAQGLKIDDLITHELSLADWKRGFELSEKKKGIKVLLKPD